MADIRWSILTPTLSSRRAKLARLLGVLLPQAEACGGTVEVVGLHNDGEKPLADYRQALLEDARGQWISFVDDDDLVADDYVTAVMHALGRNPDFVAFQHAYYEDGVRHPLPVVTGIQYDGWYDTAEALVRDITHINPVRASIARQADFRASSAGAEDWAFISALRPLLRTQVTIDRPLYHYLHSRADSTQTGLAVHAHAPRLEVASPVFRWHEWSTG